MENWGLLLFRENNVDCKREMINEFDIFQILFHPQISSPMTKKEVAKMVSHEIAHQVRDIQYDINYNISSFSGLVI